MQGIYVQSELGGPFHRPKSKKQIKEVFALNPNRVRVEATSMFGNEFGGKLTEAPLGRIDFVGPDPHHRRVFYGAIHVTAKGIKLS